MTVYADTGFLCSLYTQDAHTARAIARVKKSASILPLTWLHQLEFRNALRLRVFRHEITAAQREASLNLMLADAAAGLLIRTSPPLEAITTESERLSAQYSEHLGTRSLEILHVAAALAMGSQAFLSFDHRQIALARAAGLRTPVA